MLNTWCICAVVFHISELLNKPIRLGGESAAIDQTFDTIFVTVPVIWPRDRWVGRHQQRKGSERRRDNALVEKCVM